MPAHVRKGDTVMVTSGHYKGQIGEILRVNPEKEVVFVKGVNLKTKHLRPTRVAPQGGAVARLDFAAEHVDAVAVVAHQLAAVEDAVGEDGQFAPHQQRLGDRLHGGAAGEDHRCAIGHQAGGEPADGALAVDIGDLPDRYLRLALLERDGAAMGLAQPLVVGEGDQIAADRFARHLQLALDLGDRDRAAAIHHGKDQSLSLFGKHGRSYAISGRFGAEADVISESPLGIFSTLLHLIAIML